MGIKRKFRYLFVAASLLLFIPPAMAEDTPWEKFNLDLGYFIANTDTSVRLGSGLGVFVSSAMKMYCDTKSRIYRLSTGGISLCLNPASRRCDSMEACAQGASLTGMKPS